MRSVLAAVCLLALASPLAAGEPARKIDFTAVILDQDGAPMRECTDPDDKDCSVKRPITLGSVALRGLAMPEQNLAQDESLKRGQLGLNVYKSAGAELTAEEVALIKKQIAKAWGPLVVARAFAILDPAGR